MKRLWVFDLDDTLMSNLHDYAKPIVDAALEIIDALGTKAPHISKLIQLEHEIDSSRVHEINPETGKPFLFSMERFPTSLVETYRRIAEQADEPRDPAVEERLFAIGMTAFDESRYVRNIDPKAKETLSFLSSQGDALALCTKGDVRVQEKKISALRNAGINCFEEVYIVPEKSADTFRRIARAFPDYVPLSVGNSYSSDVAPALEAGFVGVFLPVETWDVIGQLEEVLEDVDPDRCHVISELGKIKTRYEELQ